MAGSLCPVELMKQVEEKMYMKVTSVYGLTPLHGVISTVTHFSLYTHRTFLTCFRINDFHFRKFRGYNTMKGYYKNPEATAEVLDKNNFLHSGDLGIRNSSISRG